MRILDENEAAGGNVSDLTVAGLILDGAIKPYRQHALGHRVPAHLPHTFRNARETDTRCRIMRRQFERSGIGKNRLLEGGDVDLIEMRFTVRRSVYPQTLHCAPSQSSWPNQQRRMIPGTAPRPNAFVPIPSASIATTAMRARMLELPLGQMIEPCPARGKATGLHHRASLVHPAEPRHPKFPRAATLMSGRRHSR